MGKSVLDRELDWQKDTRISVKLLEKWKVTKVNQVTTLTILAVSQ
jgi:hypothetical protein